MRLLTTRFAGVSSLASSAGAAAGHGLPGAALRRVLDHIEANLHRDPSLSELSARGYMSAFHFARLFKRSTGLPPHRFVVTRRIGRAKELLETRNVSIATVAQAVGFRTPSHFTTVFRRSMGVTPSAYRAAAWGLRVPRRDTADASSQ
jgi:AraC family transcriptional regulator